MPILRVALEQKSQRYICTYSKEAPSSTQCFGARHKVGWDVGWTNGNVGWDKVAPIALWPWAGLQYCTTFTVLTIGWRKFSQIIPQSQEIDGSSLGSHWILNMESWLLSKGQSLSWKLNARAGAEDVLVTTESYNITIHKSFVIQAHTSPCWKLSIKKNLKNHLTQNWYKCPQPPTSVSSDKTRMELPPVSVTLGRRQFYLKNHSANTMNTVWIL